MQTVIVFALVTVLMLFSGNPYLPMLFGCILSHQVPLRSAAGVVGLCVATVLKREPDFMVQMAWTGGVSVAYLLLGMLVQSLDQELLLGFVLAGALALVKRKSGVGNVLIKDEE